MPSLLNPTTLPQRHPDYVQLIQLSDLHLFSQPNRVINGVNASTNLEQLLALIQTQLTADGVLLTGDLFNEPSADNYSQLFARMEQLGLPYLAIAGNHDVTVELDQHLPFEQRRHVPVAADDRLVNCHKLQTPAWDILALNSSVSGEVAGHFSQQTLSWLADELATSQRPCMLVAHHPMWTVGSAWIDEHRLTNSEAFWQVVTPFAKRVRAVVTGHVHQEFYQTYHGIAVYTCPAVSVQFRPQCADYTLDDIPAGLRWFTLYNNGTLATGIKRIDTN